MKPHRISGSADYWVVLMVLTIFTPIVAFLLGYFFDPFWHLRRLDKDISNSVNWLGVSFPLLAASTFFDRFNKKILAHIAIGMAFVVMQILSCEVLFDSLNRVDLNSRDSIKKLMIVTAKTKDCYRTNCSYRIDLYETNLQQPFVTYLSKLDGEKVIQGNQLQIEIIPGKYEGYYLKNWKLQSASN